jgi:uroporphyrin-III C-methyltransferase
MHSKLTLVGAGPGDSELITLKGIKALQSADVILYDALANDSLLVYAPKEAIKINVGKRKGQHSFKQDEINKLIVELALEHGHVVRLKGGDPFIFGRGYEELEHAKAFGISAEVIPGVSSSIGIAAAVQIPITHRDIARSFWVFTGHTSDGSLPKDLELAAQSSATVVVLMGMGKLVEIVAIFEKYGKATLPVAIIQNGTTGEQKSVFGQIKDIVDKVNESKVSNPAVIIVGDVVGLHPDYLEAYVAEMKL